MSGPHDMAPLDMDTISQAERIAYGQGYAIAMFRAVIGHANAIHALHDMDNLRGIVDAIRESAELGLDALGDV